MEIDFKCVTITLFFIFNKIYFNLKQLLPPQVYVNDCIFNSYIKGKTNLASGGHGSVWLSADIFITFVSSMLTVWLKLSAVSSEKQFPNSPSGLPNYFPYTYNKRMIPNLQITQIFKLVHQLTFDVSFKNNSTV